MSASRCTLALKADGILAVHVSNRYVDIKPVVRGAAAELGWEVLEIEESDVAARAHREYVAARDVAMRLHRARAQFAITDPETNTVIWTDAFSSLLPLLK